MPSTSDALSPASTIALRTASTAIARVVRPERLEYSVSPTPTMQYLSRSPRLCVAISDISSRSVNVGQKCYHYSAHLAALVPAATRQPLRSHDHHSARLP